jgi:hypothetical protein
LRDWVTLEQRWFLHGVAPAVNVTSALIDTGFWLVAAVLFQLGIIRVSLLASTLVGSWIVDVQRCADAQPHGQIGACDKFAAESMRSPKPSRSQCAALSASKLLVGPLIAVRCQATSLLPRSLPGTAVALAPSELGVAITVPAYFNDAQRQATKDAG